MARCQCPCCDFFTLDDRAMWEICPICFWEDDGSRLERPDVHSSPNRMTLRKARENFRWIGACDPVMRAHVLPASEWSRYDRQVRELPALTS